MLWNVPSSFSRTVYYSYSAFGNFDSDEEPELVINEYSNNGYWLRLIDGDGAQIWEKRVNRIGNVSLADFDNDGKLEIYLPSSDALYDANGEQIWYLGAPSNYFGASIADIDADGYLDIIKYHQNGYLYIYQGSNGYVSKKIKINLPSFTLHGAPIFVDLDNDNKGELLVGGGVVTVFENESWLPASKNYSYLQQSIEEVNVKQRLSNINQLNFGQASNVAETQKESGRLSDLVLDYVEVNPSGNIWRAEFRVVNRGTLPVTAGTVVEIFRNNSNLDVNKIGEVSLAAIPIEGNSSTQYLNIDAPLSLGDEIIAKIKSRAETAECELLNNQASASTIKVTVTDTDNLSDTEYWSIGARERALAATFVTSPILNAQVGTVYQYQVIAEDPNSTDKLHYFLTRSQSGMSLDSVTGELIWTPTAAQVGRHYTEIQAIDLSGRIAYQRFYITVTGTGSNQAPIITSEASNVASANYPYLYEVKANDPDGDYLTYTLMIKPEGMSINALTGVITWNPVDSDLGNVNVVIKVTDEAGLFAEQAFTINVRTNAPPVISSIPIEGVTAGSTYLYDANATDSDGDAISYSLSVAPEGMLINSKTGLVEWLTSEGDKGEHAVSVQATDIFGAYSEQSFSITVTDIISANNPPSITSTPSGNAMFDALYSYDVNAVDSDGDTLVYLLVTAPNGMSIDNTSGLIQWTPMTSQAGSHDIVIRVEDGRGGFATQSYVVFASDGSISNELPVITSQPNFNAKTEFEYEYQVIATDADGDPLVYSLQAKPAGMTISSSGLISWISDVEQSVPVTVRVSDGKGYVEQGWTLKVLSADTALEAQLSVSPKYIDDGEVVTIQITPINAIAPLSVTVTVDGNPVDLDSAYQAQVAATGIGVHAVEATVTDKYETVIETNSFSVRDPNDTTDPVVSIISPITEGQDTTVKVTALTEIVGSVSDANLASWRLVYKERGSAPDEFVVMAEGTTNVTEQVLATFDPSMLFNGQYAIILEATDTSGQISQDSVIATVEGDLKVGNFTITLEDLNIPMAGIPVRITRTYDSRRRFEKLDFGYGWSIGYQDVKVEESRTQGKFWSLNQYPTGPLGLIPLWCVEPQGAPIVTVTLPDGDVETFETAASPRCNAGFPLLDVQVVYNAVGDTHSTLKAINDSSARLNDSTGTLVETGFFSAPVDPSRYTLTTRAGYIYYLDQSFGIIKVEDPNNHTLTYTNDGIFHSAGKSILFNRDSEGKIVDVTAPDGRIVSYHFDSNNNLQASVDPLSAKTQYSYNQNHGLLDIIDPLGRTIVKNIYNDEGRLIAQEDNDGNRTSFEHDLAGRQSVVTDRLGRTTQLFYDNEGNVTSQVDALGNITKFTFDANGNQLTKTDALNRITSATYNERNDQLTQTDALGNTVSFTYNDRGQELTITDENGEVFENTYDSFGNLLSIKDPQGNIVGNNINEQGLPSLVRDALGNETTYTYDSDGNKLTENNPLGEVTSFTYDENANVLTETRSRTLADSSAVSEVTHFEYDKQNRVVKTIDALGNAFTNEYDLIGNQVASVDALNRRIEMDYDVYGRLTETRFADGTKTTKTYDAEGNVLTETNQLNQITSFEYDALNRLIKTTLPDGSFTQTEYDAVGQVIATVDAKGNRTTHEYDLNGRRTKTTDALGNVHAFAYDKSGNLISETDALNRTTRYVYDALDRKTQSTFANNSTMFDGYDALARKTSMTDQAGVTTNYAYDALGRLTSVTDVQGNVTSFTYDEAGNKLAQTDAEGRTTRWTYDALGRVLSRTLPLGQVESSTYDAVGNRLTKTDFNGDVTTYVYDVNNRVTSITYSKDNSVESFTYDALGNRLTSTNGQGTWVYTYDVMNRLESETQPNGDVLEYSYDANGNKTQLKVTYANGDIRNEFSTYDALNRLASVTDSNGNETTYSYDAVGNRTSVTHSNANVTSYVYDELNRLTQLQDKRADETVFQQFDYELHVTGRRTKVTELNGRVSDYTYDSLYRLTDEVITDPTNGNYTASYSFDKVGNRVGSTINGVSTAYTYDANDRLTQQGGEVYTFDDNGNTLSKTIDSDVTTTYTYDAKQKLIAASILESGTTKNLNYRYNVDGIRTQKVDDGVVTNFLVDMNRDYAQVIAETDTSNTVAVEYIFGDDLLAQNRSGTLSNYHYDGLGSTRALTDSTGSVSDEYFYDAFGELLASSGSTDNSYRYTGELYDNALDQYYLRARFMDTSTGRFTQMDEWQGKMCTPITLNNYIYANSDSVNGTDPSGYFTISNLMQSVNVQGVLTTTSTSTVRSFAVRYGAGKGKKGLVKHLSCRIGASYIKASVAKDIAKMNSFRVEAHHPINKSFLKKGANGRRPRQKLLRLPSDTHHMYHWVLNVMLNESSGFGGLNNYSSGSDWQEFFSTDKKGRKRLYMKMRLAAKVVDNLCGLKKRTESIDYFVRQNKKKFF